LVDCIPEWNRAGLPDVSDDPLTIMHGECLSVTTWSAGDPVMPVVTPSETCAPGRNGCARCGHRIEMGTILRL